jgi:hypothetical protein
MYRAFSSVLWLRVWRASFSGTWSLQGAELPRRWRWIPKGPGGRLNDDLTVIINALGALKDTLSEDDPRWDYILAARKAAQRCTWLAAELLNDGR